MLVHALPAKNALDHHAHVQLAVSPAMRTDITPDILLV